MGHCRRQDHFSGGRWVGDTKLMPDELYGPKAGGSCYHLQRENIGHAEQRCRALEALCMLAMQIARQF